MKRTLAILSLASLAGCGGPPLDPGQLGTPRLIGEVRGQAPLQLLPPVSDRAGTVYVLYGAPDLPETRAFIGHPGGGWSECPSATKGITEGVHFWVGTTTNKAFYWSGDALIMVDPTTECVHILDRDPSTNGDLRFTAVIPWIDETPSRTRVVAMVQNPAESVPYIGVVDLGAKAFVSLRPYSDVVGHEVLGVGGDPTRQRGVIVFRDGAGDVAARWLDRDSKEIAVVALSGGDKIVGPISVDDHGLAAGVTRGGQVLAFDDQGGGLVRPPFTAVGVHRRNGALWVVGTQSGSPVIAPLTQAGAIGTATLWDASARAAHDMDRGMDVLNDHVTPRVWLDWPTTTSGLGAQPFVSPWPVDDNAEGITSWIVAGPTFDGGGTLYTRIAYVPVGIAYP